MDILDLQKWAYIDGLPSQNATVSELFQKYSGISDSSIEHHLLRIVRFSCASSVRATANIVTLAAAETCLGGFTTSLHRAVAVP